MADDAGVVIVAAGAGSRFGDDKVFALLGGQPVLAHSVSVFEAVPAVAAVVVVVAPENLDRARRLVAEKAWRKVVAVCAGGARRRDSVAHGLRALPPCAWTVVHDAARPLIDRTLVEEGLAAARPVGVAVAAVPANDTIKSVGESGLVTATLDRTQLWLVQTPQVFRSDLLAAAHARVSADVTDDAALLEQLGFPVAVYPGRYDNIKITHHADLILAECLLRCQAR